MCRNRAGYLWLTRLPVLARQHLRPAAAAVPLTETTNTGDPCLRLSRRSFVRRMTLRARLPLLLLLLLPLLVRCSRWRTLSDRVFHSRRLVRLLLA